MPNTKQAGKEGYASYANLPEQKKVRIQRVERENGKQEDALLKIHGNVLYNVDYRSYIDTPYAEHDVYYHTIQTYLDVTYKKNYPIRIYLTNRFSNSSFTRRFTDVNMQFNTNDFRNRLRQRIKEYRPVDMLADSLQFWQRSISLKKMEFSQMNSSVNSSAAIQKVIEQKERMAYPEVQEKKNEFPELPDPGFKKPNAPAFKKVPDYLGDWFGKHGQEQVEKPKQPAVDTGFIQSLEAKKRKMDSLQQEIMAMEKKYKDCRNRWEALQSRKNAKLDQAGSIEELDAEIKARNIPDTALPAGYKTLWAVKSFGIGRTMVDYSELSAKNVSIKGGQVEYNPGYYIAVAAGTVDYRFRDYVVENKATRGQYLALVRVGKGLKNGNNIILTWYTGKKQLYNSSSANASQPDYRLMGFTLEGNYRITPSTYLTAEVAKSSLPFYNRPEAAKSLLKTAVNFNEHSNEAYSIKVQSVIKAYGTRLSGFYKHYGASFQSFSLITTGVEQDAWMVKVDQPLMRNKLMLGASVKKNDYTNPTTDLTYQSNMVFKSVQATLRIPKWPVLFVGYYPSSQLTKLSDNEYIENMFYSLVASANHYYKAATINMSTTAMYTRFYNKMSDSAFIYSNSSTFLFNQALFFKQLIYQATATVSLSADYNLYTLHNNVQYNLLKWLTAEGGVKFNKQTNYNIGQTGVNAGAIIKVNKLGEFQFSYEKGFIPGLNRQLVSNNTGRFSYFKIF
ncbi:hypothetical protein SAMN05421788_103477 [Filimonas lacunae]|uniref:Uncharacterized protein n=1 Tax=Filimonas lacunae TaxID=477680 RepID=A0A1N7PH13_9BACT|nr:hypothetical protein [Filimonas lacunae]SIT09868.1 hypothetical protein SAMN05421788_103477 [Filimonas lacunae]